MRSGKNYAPPKSFLGLNSPVSISNPVSSNKRKHPFVDMSVNPFFTPNLNLPEGRQLGYSLDISTEGGVGRQLDSRKDPSMDTLYPDLDYELELPVPETFDVYAKKKVHRLKCPFTTEQVCYILSSVVSYVGFIVFFIYQDSVNKPNQEQPENFQEENVVFDESLLLSCEGVEAELNRFLIAESSVIDTSAKTLVISDLQISCFPKNPFARLFFESNEVSGVFFENSNISLVQTDAFGLSSGFNFSSIELNNTGLDFFLDQSLTVDSMNIFNSSIKLWSESIEADQIELIDLQEFSVDSSFIKLLTSSPKSKLSLIGFVSDDLLFSMNSKLRDTPIIVDAREGFVPSIRFQDGTLSTIPNGFFTSDNFNLFAQRVKISIENFETLEEIPLSTFSGQINALIDLSLSGCRLMEVLPEAILSLNLVSLDVSATSIKSFGGIDFSLFKNLEEIIISDSPLIDNCDDRDGFGQEFGIGENVAITPCDK
eukprot:snap_masked-scaffold_38-processed-gene-2.33-mRNA-1 protein AED:1.00 eAED:1.00 QI:0/-1/0/0/-1/1/1/0/483